MVMGQRRLLFLLFSGCFASAAAGCGDLTFGTGNEGRLTYSLYTEYEVPESDLVRARIVAGHKQHLSVGLTSNGRQDINNPGNVVHSVQPSAGVTFLNDPEGDDSPPDIYITVPDSGRYTIESHVAGERMDWIELTFEIPVSFDLVSLVRGPWDEQFHTMDGDPTIVEEGSQVAFQPAPTDADGERLAGRLTTEISVNPEWAVVPGVGVLGTWEDGIWTVEGEASFYFIDPGLVTFTVSDPITGARGDQVFQVEPIARD